MVTKWLARLVRNQDSPSAATSAESIPSDEADRSALPPGLSDLDDLPDLFGIVSWGCAATQWVAKALNAVPDVLCLHHLQNYLRYYTGYATTEESVDYFTGLRFLGRAYRLVGEVHGITRDQVPVLKEHLGEAFRAAVLVRAPGPRLLSQLRLFAQFNYSEKGWSDLDYIEKLEGYTAIAHLVTDWKRRLFVHGANMLNAILLEAPLGPMFRCEDLTSSPQAFQRLVEHLSAGQIAVSPESAEQIVKMPALNVHGKRGPKVAVEEDWQVEILRAIVRPQAMAFYAGLEYEMPEWWGETPSRAAA